MSSISPPTDLLPPRRGGRPSSQTASAAGRPAGFARLAGARRGLVGSARALAAATLLVLTGALALPATAEAQTATTLVSTVNQSPTTQLDGGSVSHERQVGQEFTTGMNGDGYILTSVDIVSASSTEFTAKVCDETSNTATCTDLTISGNFGIGTLSFTAPADTPLTGSTTYTVVLTTENVDSLGWYTTGWGATSATGEDMGAAAGWSIEDYYHGHGRTQDPPLTSAWDHDLTSPTLRIAINGYAVSGTLSSDATLSDLTVTADGTDLVTFASGTTDYAASVANDVAEVTVTAMTTDSGAMFEYLDGSDMTLTDADTGVTGQQVTLAVGDTVIKVKVTAADASTQTYKVTVTRAAAMTPTCTLNTGDLWCGVVTVEAVNVPGAGLVGYGFSEVLGAGALSDTGFSVGMNSYTIDLVYVDHSQGDGVLHFSLTSALSAGDRAKLVLHVGSASLALSDATDPGSSHGYNLTDTGLDWSSTSSVTLRLREAVISTDATLSGLAVNDGSTDVMLNPGFAPDEDTYTASVASTVAEVTVTPTTTDDGATIEYLDASNMTLADVGTAPGHQVALNVGDNVIKVKVTAEDGTTKTYAVTVNRLTPTCTLNAGDIWCGVVTVGTITSFGTGVITGYGFTSSVGNLSDKEFSVGTNDYTSDLISVGAAGTSDAGVLGFSLTSDLTAADEAKLVLHVGSAEFAFSAAFGPSGTNTYSWTSAGLDWSAAPNVTLRLRDSPISTDATLSGLAVNDGRTDVTLTPTFASGTYAYAASVANVVAEVTVTPMTTDDGAEIEYLNASDMTLADAGMTAGQQVALAVGDNVIKVKVTAEDGMTTRTYTVTVTRAPTCTPNTAAGDIWCGVVTVGALKTSGSTTGYGFSSSVGHLSDTGFRVGTNPYTVDLISVGAAGTSGAGSLFFSLTSDLAAADAAKLVLHVDSAEFAFSDAFGPSGTNTYNWVDAGLDWSSVPNVTLRLRDGSSPGDANAAPSFTSSDTFNPAENQTAVDTVEAEDSDTTDDITGYALSGGADQALFAIDDSGVLTFQAAPNYEDPKDANTDNAYVVVVRATSGTGAREKTADQTITVTVMDEDEQPDKPAKPTVSATSGSSTSLDASWTAPGRNGGPEIAGYEVQYQSRASATDAWSAVVDWPHTGTTTTTTITGLTADTEYQVQVRALNGETPSDWSDYSDAVRTNSAADAAPVFSETAPTRAVPENSAAGTDVGVPVTADDADGDTLEYTLEGTDASSFAIVSTSGQIRTTSGVTYDYEEQSSYAVTMKASDATASATIDVTINLTDEDEQPDTPAKPTVSATSGTIDSLDVTWTEPGLNGGPAIIGYGVQYRVVPSVTWVDWTHTGVATTTMITGLTASTEYQVQVQALNGETPSAWSAPSVAVPTNSASNNAPVFSETAPTREVAENSATGVDVGAPVTADDADTGDTLEYTLEGADASSFDIVSTSGQVQTKSGVTYDYEATKNSYEVTVKASDGTASATIDVTINVTDVDEQPDTPAKPTLAAVSGSTTSLDVSWTEPGLNGGPAITGYNVEYREGTTGTWVDWTHTGAATTTTITGLTASTEYQVRVRALNGETPSAWSDPSVAVLTNSASNNAPVFSETAPTRGVAENSAAGVDVGAPVTADDADTGDTLEYTLEGADASSFDIVSTSGQIQTKSGVTYDYEATKNSYEVTVKASDGTASATIDVTINVTDVDEQPDTPAKPTLAAVSGSTTSLDVSWTEPGLNGGPAITGYNVEYREGTTGTWVDWTHTGAATTTTITGLTASTEYQVHVQALNGETPSAWSDASDAVSTNAATTTPTTCMLNTGDLWCGVVTVEALDVAGVGVIAYGFSVSVDTGALSDTEFSVGTNDYTIDGAWVATNDGDLAISLTSALTATDKAKLVLDIDGSSDTFAFNDAGGPSSTYEWDSAALDWSSTSSVTLRLQDGTGTPTPSTDATLSGLTVTAGGSALVTFVSGTTDYTAMVASAVAEVTVTAMTTDTGATIDYLDGDDATLTDADTGVDGHQVTLAEGETVIKVKVTAADGNTTETYTVTVNRAAAAATCTLNTGDLWCGVVTVGTYSNGVGFTDSDGALTDNNGDQTITIGSASYTVSSVVILASPPGALVMGLDTQFPASDEETLEFHIGSSTFEVSEAAFDTGVGGYYWQNSGLSWFVGDMVDVRLRRATDDDAPTISVQDQTVNEGDLDPGNLLDDEGFPFQVTLSAASGQPVRYKVRRVELASDTATGDDLKHEILYLEQGEIAAGETSVYLRADIILDDTLDEPDETFTLEIYDFENATAGDQTRATITIADDDDPPSVSVADAEATEGDPAEFAVTLSAASGQTVTVGVATSIESSDTAAAGDFTALPATTLTFMPGDTAETVMVQTTADTLDEPDETFTLTLSSPSNVTLGDATAKGTITNNDNTALASVTIAADQPAFTAKLDDVTFTLTRTGGELAAALDVAVALTQDRTLLESEHLAQTVTFEAGEATATLIIRSYRFADHAVTEESTLTATVQTGSGYEPGSPNTASTRIVVANPAVTAWIEATAYTFAEDATGNDATIAVILRTATGVPVPNRNLYLSVSTQEISGQAESRVDYEPFTLQLEFQPSDFTSDETGFTARQEVTLVIVDDALDESDETLSVFLEPAPSLPEVVALRQPDGTACPSSVLSSGCAVTVTIVDNDDDDLDRGGICARTPRVRDRILVLLKNRHSYKGDCSGVNEEHLAELESLDLGRNPSTESAFTMSLQSDDFEGLVNLERLYLRETGLGELPAGVFSGLAALETLELDNNQLSSLPAGVFSDLQSLKTLELQKNPSLSSLPYDEFEALPKLTKLRVDPEGRRGYQVAGGEGDATLEVAAGGTTTYQVRLTHTPAYVGTASLPRLTVSSDTDGVVATPATLRFTKENWFRRQTVTVDAQASAAGATATLNHTSTGVTYDRPIPTVTVRVLESDTSRSADPLTADFQGLPSSHDGETAFSFRIAFSEAVSVTPEAMRTRVLTVAGGAVTGAARVDGESGVWSITVAPATREALSITLAPAAECEADGAVCTSDGRALSTGASAIVNGPGPDEPESNTAAAGAPTISGTAQVGEALTASTSGIADADGLDTARFAYQWIRTSADIGGATRSTYTPVAADEGTRLQVRVSFTDDAGHEERLTSAATDAVAAAPEPLTASFEGMPAEHRGQGSFSFRVAFSEGINISYTTVRDASFTVTGGEVTQARRVDGRRDRWKITIEPDSHEAVTVRLPETTDCDASGAICTDDGRPLSHALSATVAGPVGIAVADARVDENSGALLAFAVTLSRAASAALTVDYATADGSAHAGDDYRAASGTLKFRAGESSKTIEVAVFDDAHDEGEETLTLRLSNPSGGRLADGEATGTIANHDSMPRALLARFGRTAAVHVVEHVEERLAAPRAPGFRGRFAGRELRRGMERDIALSFLRQLGGAAGAGPMGAGAGGPLSGAPATGTAPLGMSGLAGDGRLAAASGPMGMVAGPLGGGSRPDSQFNGGGLVRMGLGGGDVLTGSAFELGRETGHGGILSFWSRGARSRFSGREGALSLGGDVRTTMVGADYATGPLVTGLSLSHSRGLGEYAGVAGGQVASSVTGLYPWLGYKATERVTVWGVAGYGSGGLLLTPQGGPALESGLSMAMAAAGTRGELVAGGAGGFALAFKADALWVGTSIDGVDGPAGRLKATDTAVTRVRTGLEGSRAFTLAGRLSLTPSVEVGLRHDGGDAETGAGMDVGAGLIVSDASSGLAVDLRVRTLLLHQAEGFRERGMAVSLSYNPTPSTPLGFVARVAPSWGGQATSGAEALWGRQTMAGLASGGVASGNRLDGEVGYGLPVGSRFVGTPRVGVSTSEHGRDYRLGYGLGVLNRESLTFELGIDAQRRESPLVDGASNGAIGRGTVGW